MPYRRSNPATARCTSAGPGCWCGWRSETNNATVRAWSVVVCILGPPPAGRASRGHTAKVRRPGTDPATGEVPRQLRRIAFRCETVLVYDYDLLVLGS